MKKLSKRSLAIFASVVALFLLLIVPVVTYLFVLQDSMLDVQHLTVTNVTSNSVTLTWVSDQPVYAYGAAVEGKFTEDKFSEKGDYTFSRGYDDRDIIKAELEDNYDEAQLQLERDQLGKYKTHHVTFRGLSPEKEYTFLLSDGVRFVNLDEPVVATTLEYPDSLDNPKPAYGKITVEGEKTSISLPVTDGTFYYYLEDAVGQRVSNLISTPLAENGSWYLDLNSLLALDGTKVTEKYTNDELLLMLPVGEVRSADGGLYRKVIPMDANSPAEDFRLIPERLVTEIVEQEESELMSSLDRFVFTSSAGWSVDCNGKSYCADGGVEATFNGFCASNGCNGEEKWKAEACASGAPSTCGGDGEVSMTNTVCHTEYTENGAYGANANCTSDCKNFGKEDAAGACIPEWGPGSVCTPQASDPDCNTCAGTQCIEGQYCNGGGSAQCCTGSCVNVGQENPTPTPPAGQPGGQTGGQTGVRNTLCKGVNNGKTFYICEEGIRCEDGLQATGSFASAALCNARKAELEKAGGTVNIKHALCKSSESVPTYHCQEGLSCSRGEGFTTIGSYNSLSDCEARKSELINGGSAGGNTNNQRHNLCRSNGVVPYFSCQPTQCGGGWSTIGNYINLTECNAKKTEQENGSNPPTVSPPSKLCFNNSINNKFYYCSADCGSMPTMGTYQSPEACDQARRNTTVVQAPNIPCTNCHEIPGTPTPVTTCPTCHSSTSPAPQPPAGSPAVTESTCNSTLEAMHSGYYCSKDKCGEKTNCTNEQCAQTSVPDLAVGMTQRRYATMYRCPAIANISNHLFPPSEHFNLYYSKSICEDACGDKTTDNGINWRGTCLSTAFDPFIEYVDGNDARCSTSGYKCEKTLNNKYSLYSTDAHRCNYSSIDTRSSDFNLVSNALAQSEDEGNEEVLFDPKTGLYYFPGDAEYEFFYGEDIFNVQQTAGEGSILFIDKNSNGEFDEGDERILESAYRLSFQKVIDQSSYNFEPGYNLVSFDLMLSTNKYRASDFLNYVNELDDIIYSISTYQSGKWMTMGMRAGEPYGSDDFLIVPGKAYLVKLSSPAQLKLQGYRVDEPVSLQLNSGWNLIPIHGSSKDYTAKSWLESLNRSGAFTADNVTKWDSLKGKYEGFQSDKNESGEFLDYGFDYPIDPKSGYFVKVKTGEGVWTPE